MRRIGVTSVVVIAIASSAPARAQDADATATAQQQFDRGLAEMLKGSYDVGCPAIRESVRLDPQPGAVFTLAECEAKRGKTASALGAYERYLVMFQDLTDDQRAKQHGREQIAAARKAELAATVPRATLRFAPGAPRPPSASLTLDGSPLPATSIDVALPMDPGEHEVRIQRGADAPWALRFSLSPGEQRSVMIAPPGLGPSATPTSTTPSLAPPRPVERPGSSQRTIGWIAGGIGLAGVAVGAVTGIVALDKGGAASDGCKDHVCDQTGYDAAQSGKPFALVSTIAFAVGVAGVGTGAVLLLTAPSATAGASVAGVW